MQTAISYLIYPGLPESQIKKKRIEVIDEKIQQIIKIVCNYYSLDTAEVNSPTRAGKNPECRFIIFHMLYKYKLGSTVTIGKLFNRDHSTVIKGFKVLNEWKDTGYVLSNDLGIIDKMVKEVMQ